MRHLLAFFRALAATFHSAASAQAFAGVGILILTGYVGYTIPKPSMIGALKWYVRYPLEFRKPLSDVSCHIRLTYVNVRCSQTSCELLLTISFMVLLAPQIRLRGIDSQRVSLT